MDISASKTHASQARAKFWGERNVLSANSTKNDKVQALVVSILGLYSGLAGSTAPESGCPERRLSRKFPSVRFEVFIAVTMDSAVLWDPCSVVEVYQHVGRT
jgi:hypothetical protein